MEAIAQEPGQDAAPSAGRPQHPAGCFQSPSTASSRGLGVAGGARGESSQDPFHDDWGFWPPSPPAAPRPSSPASRPGPLSPLEVAGDVRARAASGGDGRGPAAPQQPGLH